MLDCCEQVSEKESGVRQVMSTMGLLTSPFWLTWALFEGQLSFPLYSHLLLFALLFCMQNGRGGGGGGGGHFAGCSRQQPLT